jgi:hypothetical protein
MNEGKNMPIDNFAAAQDLVDRLKETIPFQVRAGFQLLDTIRDGGISANEQTWFTVDSILYAGDEGGIMCALAMEDDTKVSITSLTHLKIDPDHPLALEVKLYQQQRIARLKQSNQGNQRKPKPGRKQKKK